MAVARGQAEAGVEGGLEDVECPLQELGRHPRVVAHLADLRELEHAVHVAGVLVQDGDDHVGAEAVDSVEKLELDRLKWTTNECEDQLSEDDTLNDFLSELLRCRAGRLVFAVLQCG